MLEFLARLVWRVICWAELTVFTLLLYLLSWLPQSLLSGFYFSLFQRWSRSFVRALGVDLLRLERPAWRPGRRDRWVRLRDETAAARHLPRGARVFLATGREGLTRFAALREAYVFTRQLSEHHDPFPLPRGRFLRGASPFSVASFARRMAAPASAGSSTRSAHPPIAIAMSA